MKVLVVTDPNLFNIGTMDIGTMISRQMLKSRKDILEVIFEAACYVSGQKIKDVKSKSRNRELVTARALYMFYAREHTKKSYQTIADLLNKDHATVMHHHRTVGGYLETKDDTYIALVKEMDDIFGYNTRIGKKCLTKMSYEKVY